MLVEAISAVMYGAVFLSLILIDYVLGHGFVDMFQKIFCKVACFVKKTVREEAKQVVVIPENPISLPVLFMEILVLSLTIAVSIYNAINAALKHLYELKSKFALARKHLNYFLIFPAIETLKY